MRSVRLARIAAQAELLRLRSMVRRHAGRAVLGAVATVFGLAALVSVHAAAVVALSDRVSPVRAILIVGVADAVLAVIFGVLAARDRPGSAELEALALRRSTMEQALDAAAVTTLLSRAGQARSTREFASVAITAIAAWFLGTRR